MGMFDILLSQEGLDPVKWDYNIDIIMCIDATGSMDPILDEVKKTALSFEGIFREAMESKGKSVDQLRVKVIAFRDYIIDTVPMLESKFFVLPSERNQFKNFLDAIEASGGGDEPENALEAIATALGSDWVTTGSKRRHVILVFTDASALPLNERSGCKNYPTNLPKNLAELGSWWEGASQYYYSNYEPKSGRMVVFGPKKEPWIKMDTAWNRYWVSYSNECGLDGTKIQDVIDLLVGSVQ